MMQHLPERQTQVFQFGAREAAGAAARADSGAEEALVSVDVAHAGEQRLVEHRGFYGKLAATKKRGKFLGINGQWIGSGSVELGLPAQFAKLQAAEAARINKS